MDKKIEQLADNMLELRKLLFKRFIDREIMGQLMPRDGHMVLIMLDKQGSATMTEISKELLIPKPNVTPIVDKLVATGYVAREQSDTDRRVVRIVMTKEGKAQLQWARKKLRSYIQAKLVRLPKTELKALASAVQTVHQILQNIQ